MNVLTIEELVIASDGKLVCGEPTDTIANIVIDSREAKYNNAFVAIVGENLDAHTFISSAIKQGCKTIIKNKNYIMDIINKNLNIIEVDDTTLALGTISKYYKEKFDIDFVGVTGSVGKTTTRDMIYSALSSKLNVLKNQKNLNNHFGVPITLFKLNDSHDCAVIEMGMSHYDEIKYLADIVKPKIGVISNIGLSHIENLGSQEGILKAKMEISLNFNENNILVVNGDDQYLSTLKNKKLPYILKTFGFKKDNDIYCEEFTLNEKSTTFTCIINGEKHEIFIPIMGEHNIYNAMAAILVGLSLNLTIEDIKEGLINFEGTKMRLDINEDGSYIVINDSYNASPDSMSAALKILGRYNNRRIAILGDMLEMGEFAESGHRSVGKPVFENADVLITIGKDSDFIGKEAIKLGFDKKNVYHFLSRDEAIESMDNLLKINDVVLVKASRGMKLETVVEYINNK
ncbi:UDP-N-acetylmuramoyl-tripeptide--D-alanyl-D-alanine ligase [Clostridioides mangenotii]|uniref:UDP-N-acetylmuramoyl-tripeptide--D-alanyl-D- alanine ligase n=1 Tax=Metaclostridioides mangenotii TaxID=1540 RepID=UPI001C10CFCC|nr:UDP-N-acetylmuramoyl-tripeptide--D-alanyl-D-alanine ligase [Clostridioides mangenotii]